MLMNKGIILFCIYRVKQYKHNYDYIFIDSNLELNLLTINTLTPRDSIIDRIVCNKWIG